MRASIEEKKGYLYVKLTYRVNNERKFKTVSTGLKAKGNKALLKSKLDDYISRRRTDTSWLCGEVP